jgi:hypothetical protein
MHGVMNYKNWAALLLIAVCTLCISRDLHAQDKAAAESLFDEGRKKMTAGDYVAACDLFERSQQADASVGTLLNLAACYEKQKKFAKAWTQYRQAGNLAARLGDPRGKIAAEKAQAIEGKLSKLTITVAAKADGLEVTRDGEKISSALYGAPVPVDAGSHVITATAPGKKDWKQEITLGEGEGKSVTIPELEDGSGAAAAAEGGGTAPVVSDSGEPSSDRPAKKSKQRMYALIAGGVGVVGIGVGTFLGLSAKSKNDDAKSGCTDGTSNCSADSVQKSKDARSQANLATVAFGVGIVGLAAGVVLWVTAPKSTSTAAQKRKRHVAVIPLVSRNVSGLVIEGALP